MSLTVLSIAFPFAAVGPNSVGGAEEILATMDEALTEAGHNSIVVACEGSQTQGSLFPVPQPRASVLTEADQARARDQYQAAIDRALAAHTVDLVHMHCMDFHEYRIAADIPVLVTLHLPIAWYPARVWERLARTAQFVCVSESQRRTCPPELRNVMVIENGIALPPYREQNKENFALVLGRICPEKNQHEALQAGTAAGVPVLLGGSVYRYRDHLRYFDEKIKPLLEQRDGNPGHRFLGRVGPERKWELLAKARCLLHPTLAPETSSLVAMEAIAAGTPVIAYPSGALPEVVQHGETGLLVHGPAQMADAIRRLDSISPRKCREAAERRFAKEHMVQRYLQLYGDIAQTRRIEPLYA